MKLVAGVSIPMSMVSVQYFEEAMEATNLSKEISALASRHSATQMKTLPSRKCMAMDVKDNSQSRTVVAARELLSGQVFNCGEVPDDFTALPHNGGA